MFYSQCLNCRLSEHINFICFVLQADELSNVQMYYPSQVVHQKFRHSMNLVIEKLISQQHRWILNGLHIYLQDPWMRINQRCQMFYSQCLNCRLSEHINFICFVLQADELSNVQMYYPSQVVHQKFRHSMNLVIEKLISQQHRSSTAKIYLSIWRQFNRFVLSLDIVSKSWEERTTLFVGFLIEKGMQSATVKTYVSAIKKMLVMDKYNWQDSKVLMSSLTRACHLVNDRVKARFAIKCGLLELILFEVERFFGSRKQWYLECLYKALFAISYYGLMHVGEVTNSPHVLCVCNVHVAKNKENFLLVLYSSKTHDLKNLPQKIKITSNRNERMGNYVHRHFCPFKLIKLFLQERGNYMDENEPFFVFRDKKAVNAEAARKLLRTLLKNLSLDGLLYDMHSFRIGRTSDLAKSGYTIPEIQRMGIWHSNVVYKYIRM